jgi:5S rRNA maturation endonuclease (ribonuclease M5)
VRQVYVCDGTRVLRAHAQPELQALASLGRPLLVLTDPDERGRELRGHLDAALTPLVPRARLLHAFVPEASAMASAAGAVHGVGNRGIEHAVPEVLVTAIRLAAPAHERGRAAWDLDRLQALRLARPFDGGAAAQGERLQQGAAAGTGGGGGGDEPRERRRRLCTLLGLGKCNGAQLAAALNKYFSEERVAAALAAVDGAGEQ